MSGIDKDNWFGKAGKTEAERMWAMFMGQIEGEDAVNAETSNTSVGENGGNEATYAEMSDAPLLANDGETVAGEAVHTGSAPPTEDNATDGETVAGGVVDTGSAPPTEDNAANEAPNTQTARGNTQTLRVRCLLCERVVPRGLFPQHALSNRHRHRQKVRARQSASATEAASLPETEPYPDSEYPPVNNKPVAANKPIQCGYCDRSYASRETFKAHCKTDKHQERKAQKDREEGRLGPEPEPVPRAGARWTLQEDELILRSWWDLEHERQIMDALSHRRHHGVLARRRALVNDSQYEELRTRVHRELREQQEKEAKEKK